MIHKHCLFGKDTNQNNFQRCIDDLHDNDALHCEKHCKLNRLKQSSYESDDFFSIWALDMIQQGSWNCPFWGDPTMQIYGKFMQIQGFSIQYPFPHNHGSVENYSKQKETIGDTPIFHCMGERVMPCLGWLSYSWPCTLRLFLLFWSQCNRKNLSHRIHGTSILCIYLHLVNFFNGKLIGKYTIPVFTYI